MATGAGLGPLGCTGREAPRWEGIQGETRFGGMKRMISTCRQVGYKSALPRAWLEDDTTMGPSVTLLVPEYKGPMS